MKDLKEIRIGETYVNNYGNEYVIVDYEGNNKVTVEFKKYGYVRTGLYYHNVRLGRTYCPFDKRYYGVACIGLMSDGTEPVLIINGEETKEYKLWMAMIYRVYSESQLKHHSSYRKCKVCDRWLVYANFLEDIKSLPNYELWLHSDQYELDKDLLQHGQEFKIYSPTTCMFVPKNVNIRLPKPKKEKAPKPQKIFRLTHIESGMYMDYKKQEEVAGKLGVTQSYISKLVKKGETYKGYKIEKMYV